MNRGEFDRKRAHIRGTPRRRKRALQHLLEDAGAREVKRGSHTVGFRLADGVTVCVKQRYRDSVAANDALFQIQQLPGENVRPVRAYPCQMCRGWHLTKRQA